ncbi:hypothetical protein BCD67_23080 [Oscillatoriales cyanobacterium USR001]|nr:hypothetical protein BCD67_23080 [Oscillatoriales cyanobacterium USR001]
MTFPYLPRPTELPLDPRQSLPTMYDLPFEDPEEDGLPDTFHIDQPQLLEFTFLPPNWDENQVFTATNLYLYYDVAHSRWYKRPNWFAAVGVSRLYEGHDMRFSYVIWQEQVSPFVVVELLSPGTEDEDFGRTMQRQGRPPTKWQVYEQILQVPYYFVFSRHTDELQAFHLINGRYQSVELTCGQLLIPELQLRLGLWQGDYKGMNRLWLRWFTADGELILSPSERAILAERQVIESQQKVIEFQQQVSEFQQQLSESQKQVIAAQEKAERLAARLRELGIEPD